MTLFNLFNACKTIAVAGEATHLIRFLHPEIAATRPYLVLGLLGEVGYFVVMVMMMGTELGMVTSFLIGMSLIQKFMTSLYPAWEAVDSVICILVLLKFALYIK